MSNANNLFSDFELTTVKLEYTKFAQTASLSDNHFNLVIEVPEGKREGLTKMIFDYLKQEEDENEKV